MEQEFITIAEAVRLTGESDVTLMRLLKEALEVSGISLEQITRKEQREKGMMYLLNKEFLLKALAGEPIEIKTPKEVDPQEEVEFRAIEVVEERSTASTETSGEVLKVKDEMIDILQRVIETKDGQIGDLSKKIDQLIERDRETNFLLKGLQDRIFLLERSNGEPSEEKEDAAKKEKRTPR
ncbi:MAG: hypothetical protein Q7R55_00410 [Candidatus Wildermuthbacteria bacterium]|nr:hypothetical protein [Candidatus Wildermuthbacteria bacterium]